ncbi:MAG: spore coat protein [Ruminococcaceae bacterium]|nr:spore coat protein [Oscillospiraceae bacterium]
MQETNKASLTEKEMMQECLGSQRSITEAYNARAFTCSDEQLQKTFLNLLTEEHELGAKVTDAMTSRGWHQEKEAEKTELAKTKEKFMGD